MFPAISNELKLQGENQSAEMSEIVNVILNKINEGTKNLLLTIKNLIHDSEIETINKLTLFANHSKTQLNNVEKRMNESAIEIQKENMELKVKLQFLQIDFLNLNNTLTDHFTNLNNTLKQNKDFYQEQLEIQDKQLRERDFFFIIILIWVQLFFFISGAILVMCNNKCKNTNNKNKNTDIELREFKNIL